MSDSNHLDKITLEQRELLQQFEQSLQNNFKRLMSNVSKPKPQKSSSEESDEEPDSDEDFREIEKRVNENILGTLGGKGDIGLFEQSSDSDDVVEEKPGRHNADVDDESNSNSEVGMVSKFMDKKEGSVDVDKNEGKNASGLRQPPKAIKARTQTEFGKPQLIKNATTDVRPLNGVRGQPVPISSNRAIPIRSRTPQPVSFNRPNAYPLKNTTSGLKERSRHDSNKSGTLSMTNAEQKEIFNNYKLNTSINKKNKTSVVSVYSTKDDKGGNEYKAKYTKLAKEHSDLKEKFSSLYDKHQRLLKLFNKLEEKYRVQADKLRTVGTHQPNVQSRPSTSKVTVPKSIARPDSGRRIANPQRKAN